MTDVFISYAHADDQSLSERAKGWVTEFADRLQTAVRMKEGGSRIKVWMDQRLEPQKAVDAALATRVTASACFVAIMSPRYLESDWCRKELDTFVTRVGRGTSGDRVFLAEFLPTERSAWHPAIQSISPVQFWSQPFDQPAAMTLGWPSPDPTSDRPYWNTLNELAHFLAQQVKALGATPARATPTKARVWIADPTDNVLDRWDSLASALRQEGCEVLPSTPGAYPVSPEQDFSTALEADLSQAQLLVQLLGPHPGRRPPWAAASFTRLQAEAARAQAASRGVAHLTWRTPDIKLEDVADADHRALLTGAIAGGFEEFRQQVLKRLADLAAPVMPATAGAGILDPDQPISICVSADKPDRALGASVRDLLFDLGVDVSLTPEPSEGQSPAQWRHDYESVLNESHGLVVLYGNAPPSWVQTQVQAAKKTLAQARKGIWGALLDLPPADKPDHGMRMRNLMLLDCRGGLATEALERFVSALRGGAHV